MTIAAMLEGLIPLCGGIYATLLGFGKIRPGRSGPRIDAVLAQLKWLGPVVIVFGLVLIWRGYDDGAPNVDEIVRGMRARVELPVAVDEVTRLDAFDAVESRIVYRLTITRPPPTAAERDALLTAMRRQILGENCKSGDFQRLLAQGIGLEFVYTMEGKRYPGIAVTRANCGLKTS